MLSSLHVIVENIVKADNEKDSVDEMDIDGKLCSDDNKMILIREEPITYNYYHNDIWFVISKFICPEDVSCFARICKQTEYICTTATFWNNLYKRHYRDMDKMPDRLKPEYMLRLGGLRACVIRSLYFTYEPFLKRLPLLVQQDSCILEKRECVASWAIEIKDNWHFCYKLKQKLRPGSRAAISEQIKMKNSFLEVYQDIYQNTEENCKILVVITFEFI